MTHTINPSLPFPGTCSPRRRIDAVELPDAARWVASRSHATVSARQLAAFLGAQEIADLESWGPAIGAACADLGACDSSIVWRHTPDTPTVVLLRALGRLAFVAPDVSSSSAGALIDAVTSANRRQPDSTRRGGSTKRGPSLRARLWRRRPSVRRETDEVT